MKLILTHEVTGLGAPGDIVEVKNGYARNYLLPRNVATPWSRGAERQVESIRKARQAREFKSFDDAQTAKVQIESSVYTVTAHAGANGRLFGAVGAADVADAIEARGVKVDKRKIEFPSAIKTTGEAQAVVRLHPEVSARIKLDVVAG